MFVSSFDRIDLGTTSEVVSFSRSNCGNFICVLFRDSVQIRDLNSRRLSPLLDFRESEGGSVPSNFNHWCEWINEGCLAVGSQTGRVSFLNLDAWGKLLNTHSLTLDSIITAHTSMFGALILATPGPEIQVISPTGEVLSRLSFRNVSMPLLVRNLDAAAPLLCVTFTNGTCGKVIVTEDDLLQEKELEVTPFGITDVAAARVSFDKSFIVLLTFSGSLMKMCENGEIVVVNENASQFQITKDGIHIVSLEANGGLNIWSSQTMRNSRTRIDFPFLCDTKNPNFITSELDFYGLRYFCGTSKDMFVVVFAAASQGIPSLIYHTPTTVIVPTTKTTIAAPQDLIAAGFPLLFVAYSPSNKATVLAGRKGYAIHRDSQWHLVNDADNLCRALWYQCGYFVSVVFDVTRPQYKLLLLNKDELVVVFEAQISGAFVCCDKYQNKIAIGTPQSVFFYEISDSRLMLIKRFDELPAFHHVSVLNAECEFLLVTHDKELLQMPKNDVLMEGVTRVHVASESGLIFAVSHGQEFVLCDDRIIRLGKAATHIEGLSRYITPSEYRVGEFNWDVGDFLPDVFDILLTEPDRMEQLLNAYLKTNGITIAVAHSLERALDAKKFDLFNDFLNRMENARETFLIVALFQVKRQYAPIIKHLLPPYDQLLTKFPQLRTQLQQMYEQ